MYILDDSIKWDYEKNFEVSVTVYEQGTLIASTPWAQSWPKPVLGHSSKLKLGSSINMNNNDQQIFLAFYCTQVMHHSCRRSLLTMGWGRWHWSNWAELKIVHMNLPTTTPNASSVISTSLMVIKNHLTLSALILHTYIGSPNNLISELNTLHLHFIFINDKKHQWHPRNFTTYGTLKLISRH